MKKLRFVPFWQVTRFGFIRPLWGIGCDEWHNPSWYFIIPLVGWFIFDTIKYDRSGPMHLFAKGPDGWEGVDLSDECEICQEVLDED